jgi:hypothetical protein
MGRASTPPPSWLLGHPPLNNGRTLLDSEVVGSRRAFDQEGDGRATEVGGGLGHARAGEGVRGHES